MSRQGTEMVGIAPFDTPTFSQNVGELIAWATSAPLKRAAQSAMTPAIRYHERAEECLREADKISDVGDRAVIRELAICWLQLADDAARQGAQRYSAA
jgi:hypothetical protein